MHEINCPRCHAPIPRKRKPKSRREALWGGATCDTCGCEIDKWGNQKSQLELLKPLLITIPDR
jgi:hypothetical protein